MVICIYGLYQRIQAMTEKLKCPFCGTELETDNEIARLIMWRCHTPGCLLNGWHSAEIIQHLIAGKKAQQQLRTVKDRCVKKIKAKEFEIHNCLYGIHVRDCEIETLQEKLSQAQDALESIYKILILDSVDKSLTLTPAGKQEIKCKITNAQQDTKE